MYIKNKKAILTVKFNNFLHENISFVIKTIYIMLHVHYICFSKVINHVMKMGDKKLARSLVEKSFENIKRIQIERYHLASSPEEKAKIILNPKDIIHKAVENSKPLLQLLPIKRGGITYQVWILYDSLSYIYVNNSSIFVFESNYSGLKILLMLVNGGCSGCIRILHHLN